MRAREGASNLGPVLPPPLTSLLHRQCGVVSLQEALGYLPEKTIRRRLNAGYWQLADRAVLVTHSGPLSRDQLLWVALKRAGPGAVLGGVTAAGLAGLRGFPASIHVIIPASRRVTGSLTFTLHRSRQLTEQDVQPLRLPLRTRLPRALVDAAGWAATADDARAVLAAGVQQRLVTQAQLREVVNRLSKQRRRRLILETLDDIGDGAHSVLELLFAGLCRRAKLPTPTRQAPRVDGSGRKRWLDVAWEEYGVVVEIDGAWHMEASTWWADLSRQNKVVAGGEVVLRYPAYLLRSSPEKVAAEIAGVLRARGWQG